MPLLALLLTEGHVRHGLSMTCLNWKNGALQP